MDSTHIRQDPDLRALGIWSRKGEPLTKQSNGCRVRFIRCRHWEEGSISFPVGYRKVSTVKGDLNAALSKFLCRSKMELMGHGPYR